MISDASVEKEKIMTVKSNRLKNLNFKDESTSNNPLEEPLFSDFDSIIVQKILPIANMYINKKF